MLYLLPGMGLNHRMYTESTGWDDLEDVTFLDWPKYNGETTLKEVAERLIKNHGITTKDIVGGSCLGGMVSIEIQKILDSPKVILLGSATNKLEINSILRKLSSISGMVPLKFIQLVNEKKQNRIMNMLAESETKFIKSMCSAINRWEGYYESQKNIIRVHGKKDMIIKCPEKCFLIEQGGHFISMTHPKECLNFIKINH